VLFVVIASVLNILDVTLYRRSWMKMRAWQRKKWLNCAGMQTEWSKNGRRQMQSRQMIAVPKLNDSRCWVPYSLMLTCLAHSASLPSGLYVLLLLPFFLSYSLHRLSSLSC